MTNVTARHGQGAVHLGASEQVDGSWMPACGMQFAASYARTPAKLRPTNEAVTCKRCLKRGKPEPEPEGSGIDWTDPNEKFYAFGSKPPEPESSEKTGIETLQELLTFD